MVAEGGEGENPLLFSLTAPKRGGGWGGGGRGGIPASFPSRSPPPKQPFQPTPTPSPSSHNRWFLWGVLVGRAPRFGGPGPKPPGDLAHRPLNLGSRRVDFLQACNHNPQSACGVGWFLKTGPKPWAPSPLETWPTGSWGLDPATLTGSLPASLLP